jgi:hypothetical protein
MFFIGFLIGFVLILLIGFLVRFIPILVVGFLVKLALIPLTRISPLVFVELPNPAKKGSNLSY